MAVARKKFWWICPGLFKALRRCSSEKDWLLGTSGKLEEIIAWKPGYAVWGLSKSGLRGVPGAPLGSAWLEGSWPPLPHTHPQPSLSGYHTCLSLFSFFLPSSFLNYCSSAPHHFLSTPLPCCSILLVVFKISSSILHILFSLVLHPWLLLVLLVLCFKKKGFILIQVFAPLLFVIICCFNSFVCYWCILEVSWDHCFVVGFYLLLPKVWCRCRTCAE